MRSLIGFYRLRELLHYRVQETLVGEPMGKKVHAHKRQTGCNADDLCARGHRRTARSLARTALGPIEPPLHPQPVEMADTHRHQSLALGEIHDSTLLKIHVRMQSVHSPL